MFCRIRRANLLQSYDYARALCPIKLQKARWGIIYIDGQKAGLLQVTESGLAGNLLHGIALDRGPLWFEGFGSQEHSRAFFRAFNELCPRRFGRVRRVLPEIGKNENMAQFMAQNGYKKRYGEGYQTAWLDLSPSLQDLRAGLKGKWRNRLTKAEKSALTVEWDIKGSHLPWLLTNYQYDKAKKGYDGPPVRIIRALAGTFLPSGNMIIGRALLENEAVAGILLLCHGAAATYQVGWSSEKGRDLAAHNLLLWNAAEFLKDKGIKDFDLGGINDESAKGVKFFKEGLGGETVTYLGNYA